MFARCMRSLCTVWKALVGIMIKHTFVCNFRFSSSRFFIFYFIFVNSPLRFAIARSSNSIKRNLRVCESSHLPGPLAVYAHPKYNNVCVRQVHLTHWVHIVDSILSLNKFQYHSLELPHFWVFIVLYVDGGAGSSPHHDGAIIATIEKTSSTTQNLFIYFLFGHSVEMFLSILFIFAFKSRDCERYRDFFYMELNSTVYKIKCYLEIRNGTEILRMKKERRKRWEMNRDKCLIESHLIK